MAQKRLMTHVVVTQARSAQGGQSAATRRRTETTPAGAECWNSPSSDGNKAQHKRGRAAGAQRSGPRARGGPTSTKDPRRPGVRDGLGLAHPAGHRPAEGLGDTTLPGSRLGAPTCAPRLLQLGADPLHGPGRDLGPKVPVKRGRCSALWNEGVVVTRRAPR